MNIRADLEEGMRLVKEFYPQLTDREVVDKYDSMLMDLACAQAEGWTSQLWEAWGLDDHQVERFQEVVQFD